MGEHDGVDIVLVYLMIALGAFSVFLMVLTAINGGEGGLSESEKREAAGRVNRLHDSVSDSTLLKKVEDKWEELGVADVIDKVEEEISKGNVDYQPRRSRRVENRGEEFLLTRKFVKDGEGYVIEGTLYYITRQHYMAGIVNKYKDHEIELMKVIFGVDVDKNEYGWKISNIRVVGSG